MDDTNSQNHNDYNNGDRQEDAVFHYNREERISKAPSIVQDKYNGTGIKPPSGLFEALVHTKSSRFMLFALIGALAVTCFLWIFKQDDSGGSIANVPVSLSAFSFDDTVYVSVKLSAKANFEGQSPVSVSVDFIGKENEIVKKENAGGFYNGNETFFRTTSTDYDIISINAVVEFLGESIKLAVPVVQQ